MSSLKTDKNGFPMEIPYEISECQDRELGYKAIQAQLNFLLGKILTIVDASIEDKQRNKAFKDLVKDAFSQKSNWIYQLCGLPEINDEIGGGKEILKDLPRKTVNQKVTKK